MLPKTIARCVLTSALCLAGTALPAAAADGEEGAAAEEGASGTQSELPDRIKLFGGYQLVYDVDAKFRFDGFNTGLGSTFDFDDDLGGDEEDYMAKAGARLRINPRHAIGFSWYDINLNGDEILDVSLEIEDLAFLANGEISSNIDLSLYRVFYSWSFYRSERVEIALSPGLYFGKFEASFDGQLTIEPGEPDPVVERAQVEEEVFAPLPTLGLTLDYYILPRLRAGLRTDFFWLEVGDIEGNLAELTLGLEYRLFKHLGVGVALNRLWLDIDYDAGSSNGWAVDASWNGFMGFGAIYF